MIPNKKKKYKGGVLYKFYKNRTLILKIMENVNIYNKNDIPLNNFNIFNKIINMKKKI